MSNRYEGVKCPVCNGYLFEDADDIVVCPMCGAPHHRSCYNSIGHCGLQEFHGTENQYDKVQKAKTNAQAEGNKEVSCPGCGKPLAEDMLFCPHCGKMRDEKSQPEQDPRYRFFVNQFDPLGGVHPATDLGEGVTAKQAAEFIKVNTTRYIPKFASPKKASWNWLAFLLPHSFFFYHKMYKTGFIVTITYLASIILCLPMQAETVQLMSSLPIDATTPDMLNAAMQNGFGFSGAALGLYSIGLILVLLLRILCGVFADHWYKGHVIKSVKTLSLLEPEEKAHQYIKKGLPNIYLLFFVTLLFYWIPNILLTLFI